MKNELHNLFANNRRWAAAIRERDPAFFETLAKQQSPQYLWIGCSDSRVPANEIVGLMPGEVFVHRNVANVVVHTDLNCLSVVQFAVDVLNIKHVMVVGHYGCGGVAAALRNRKLGLADNWLRHVQDVQKKHAATYAHTHPVGDDALLVDRLCELNVIEQVQNACQTTVVQDAWERGQELTVHGWIYRLQDGELRDLCATAAGPAEVDSAIQTAIARLAPLAP
ncbi:MAG: carbonate dehydratase [Gammaproteobacteria bacterium]|nr:carbonate dehydratase [Gammaproteobacteria bacterium]